MDREFLGKLASEDPTPGGGTASAISGSMGAALLSMVAKLSRKENPDADAVSQKGEAFLETCLQLSKEDEEAFNGVVAAFKLPKKTDEEKLARSRVIEESLKNASRVPLETARTALEILQLTESFLPKANKNALSDIGVSALLAHAAFEGAIFNVLINLASIKDKSFVEEYRANVEALRKKVKPCADGILASVNHTLQS